MLPHLPHIKDLLWADDGLWAELADRHQTLDAVVETNNAAKVFDADNVAVGHTARTGISIAEEQRQGAFNQGLLSGKVQLFILCIYWQHLKECVHTQTKNDLGISLTLGSADNKCQLKLTESLRCKIENWTDATFDLHALYVLLLRVLQDDIGQVGPRNQAFNVVRHMHHHAMVQQNWHSYLEGIDTWNEDNVRQTTDNRHREMADVK